MTKREELEENLKGAGYNNDFVKEFEDGRFLISITFYTYGFVLTVYEFSNMEKESSGKCCFQEHYSYEDWLEKLDEFNRIHWKGIIREGCEYRFLHPPQSVGEDTKKWDRNWLSGVEATEWLKGTYADTDGTYASKEGTYARLDSLTALTYATWSLSTDTNSYNYKNAVV